VNRARLKQARAGMVMDGGAPRCLGCDQPLHFGTDRQGRTTESCACGYQGYLKTRTGCTRDPLNPLLPVAASSYDTK